MPSVGCVATFTTCAVLVAVLMITLLAVSIKQVNEGTVAVVYLDLSEKFSGEPITPGFHTLPPDNKLYVFETRFQSRDVSGQCRSRDGIHIQIQTTFQFNFAVDSLIKSMTTYGTKDKTVSHMHRQAHAAVNKACSYFDAVDFTRERALIELNMSRTIELAMSNSSAFVNVGAFQFRNFEYPRNFQDAVNSKQRTSQQKDVVTSQRPGIIILATTHLRQAQEAVQILINDANAQANTLIDSAKIAANAVLASWNQTIVQLQLEMNNLGMNFSTFVDYKMDTLLRNANHPIINLPSLSVS
jgi:regulator of protease activity HflC (stomatin/prohibitin superfamily)